MKQLDYGRGYRYAHDEADGFAAGESYFPDDMGSPPNFYRPTDRGLEQQIADKLERMRAENTGARRDAKREE
jgi:putative ATPase